MKRTKRRTTPPPAIVAVQEADCVFNVEVCGMMKGIPAGVKVRVRASTPEAARARAREILGGGDGLTVLRAGDYDLKDGENVRLYLDGSLMADDCPCVLELDDEEWG